MIGKTGKTAFLLALACVWTVAAAPRPFIPQFFFNSPGDFKAFRGLPAFEEYIPVYVLPRVPKPDVRPFQKHQEYRKKYVRRVPENERRKTPYGIEDLMGNPRRTVDSDYARSGKPFFVYEPISRPLYFIPGDGCPLADRKAFAEWKKKHPGFQGFNSLWEMDSDTTYFTRFWDKIEDKDLKRDLQAGFEPPYAKGKGHLLSWTREVMRRLKDFHWGESRIWPMCSNDMGFEHLFAANGASGLWYEATTQSWGAWNAAGAFLRGAARQWNLPTGWYMAQYYTGHARNGEFRQGGSKWFGSERFPLVQTVSGSYPHRGEGRSLHRRQALYGWLIGADYIQMEGWLALYRRKENGKIVPSEYALDFNEIYMLSKTVDRGESFTPLAVLTPLAEPSATTYRNGNLLEPETQTTIFRALVPITSEYIGGDHPRRVKGEQGCLYNSEFPGFFDSLCPDSGQDSAAFEKVLSRYRHVLIAGDAFDRKKFDSRALAAFEKAGGKVHRYPSPECPTPEALRELLLSIRDETMPFSVEGDIQWGVNKTEKGWLIYLINNKGVVKFCDEPEEYDLAKTAKVTVKCKATGETRTAEVKPGDFKLMEFNIGSTAYTVVDCGGVPRFAVNGIPRFSTAVMPSPSVLPGAAVGRLSEFARQGVELSSDIWMMNDKRYAPRIWWLGEGVYDFKMFDALVKGLLDASPNGVIFPRIKLDPPGSWMKEHPEELFAGMVRPESAAWRELYRRMLRDMVAHVEASAYADRIGGYQVAALHCGEWLFKTPPYRNSLPETGWDRRDPLPPEYVISERKRIGKEMSDRVARAMVEASDYLRELTGRRKWIGSFLGYCSFPHESLSLALEKGRFDFCAAPPHYGAMRETGATGRSQAYAQGSYRLHGCVYFEESDFRTFLSDPKCSFPPKTRRRPLDETLALMRRSIGKCLAGGWEHWWFLLGGNDSYSHPEMQAVVRRGVELGRETLTTARWKPADVAIFTSFDGYATSVANESLELRHDLKVRIHTELLPRCGVTFDSYVLEDIADPRLPDYKVYFFPNAITVKPELREKIKERVRRAGKTAVWAFAPGYYDGKTNSVELVADLTGIRLTERYPVKKGKYSRVFETPHGTVAGKDGWSSIYIPIPESPAALREAFRAAGAHVWSETDDTFAAGRGFVMIHSASDGEKKISLPGRYDVTEVFGSAPSLEGVTAFAGYLKKGETRVYRLRVKEEFLRR